ncbi:hypothetical protein [Microbacterium ulmi]|uniref:VIT family protein n=1 Tax=Microbacterium ulmi TaxID=179095 RepID=A0A7Y2M1B9_9MICO|nr:hypothetical protein [Microbacterium ulmi]NII71441.1 lysylphosphatidylglycerol synthetase-like protein (DUF2156 family) [Microbacterium ulmi]NNH04655.1 hypothetical protein [Microbacterium ulmi]
MPDGPSRALTTIGRILISEESVYGLILVSGMIVVSNSLTGTSANALLTVVITVIVFFSAHVYAGTIAGLAKEHTRGSVRASFAAAFHHSEGMLLIAIAPIAVLLLGVGRVLDDDVAIWTALIVDTVILGVLGWFAVASWVKRFWPRMLSAVITAAFGAVLILLKALIHH